MFYISVTEAKPSTNLKKKKLISDHQVPSVTIPPTVTFISISFDINNDSSLSNSSPTTSVLATAAVELLGQRGGGIVQKQRQIETVLSIVALFFLPLLLCTFGFVGNMLVLISIGIERRLQNTTNYFLFSLALADLLVCVVVMPFSILVELGSGMWAWTFQWGFFSCLLYTYADVFLCSCSIVHMTVISFDRYLGVSQPLKRHNKRKRTLLKIFIVWILSTIISSPLALLSFVEQQNILAGNRCGIRSRFFMLYGSVFSFLIPLAIMAITTSRTAHLLQRQAILLGAGNHFSGGLRRIMAPQRKMGGQAPMMFITNFSGGLANSSSSTTTSSGRSGTITQQIQNCQRRLSFSTGSQIQSPTNFSTTAFRVGEKHCAVVHQRRPPLDSPIIKISPAATDEKLFKSGNNNPSVATSASNECKFIQQKQKQNATPSSRKASLFGAAFWPQSLLRKSAESSGAESQGTKARKRRRRRVRTGRAKRTAELASEQKATRVLIVVFSSFFICWTPFFVQNIILGLCGLDQCGFPGWASLCALWFGYCSSTVNPIIYTIFNKRFREMFIRILQCHYWTCCPFRHGNNLRVGHAHWATWTDANISSYAHQSRTHETATLGTAGRVPAQRRSSYAAGMPLLRDVNPPSINSPAKFRRSTLFVPQNLFGIVAGEIGSNSHTQQKFSFVAAGAMPPPATLMLSPANRVPPLKRKLSGEESIGHSQETSKLYTGNNHLNNRRLNQQFSLNFISDSDEKDEEEELNATSSLESNEEAEEVDEVECTSRSRNVSSRTATEGVALIARNCVAFGDILRKMSWQRIARSLSVDLEHHQHQNANRMRRDCTMYSLLTVPGEVASGGSADHFACGVTLLQKKSAPTFVNESAKTNSWESSDGNHLLAERFDAASEQFFSKQIHKITTTKAKI
uniref:G-protein coupled receptors family 1 profile domain-containing protein n=1 Tax=Globodera rostochiensis TaxID=31243 RepID=A0A914HVV5_GLORO